MDRTSLQRNIALAPSGVNDYIQWMFLLLIGTMSLLQRLASRTESLAAGHSAAPSVGMKESL